MLPVFPVYRKSDAKRKRSCNPCQRERHDVDETRFLARPCTALPRLSNNAADPDAHTRIPTPPLIRITYLRLPKKRRIPYVAPNAIAAKEPP